jgi:nitric oxide synthase-interacting protein
MARAAWTSSQARLTRDSFLPFGSCCLCLELAKDPVACQLGDIFCRECALANLVAQKKEIKRLHKARLTAEREVEQAKAQVDAEARKRAVKEFEGLQAGVASGTGTGTGTGIEPKHGTKRKFDLDADEMERISKQDVTRAKEAMAAEKVRGRHGILMIFFFFSYLPDLSSFPLTIT